MTWIQIIFLVFAFGYMVNDVFTYMTIRKTPTVSYGLKGYILGGISRTAILIFIVWYGGFFA